jgi:hypothetical protein
VEHLEARGPEAVREQVALGRERARQLRRLSPACSSATTAACWSGVPPAKVRNCLTPRTADTSSAGPVAQPIFQPVNECVLPSEETLIVRSAIPSRVEIGMCSPS